MQLYELALSAASLALPPTGDFNGDGNVNASDFLVWQRSTFASGANLPADGNHDGVVDAADIAVWTQQFGGTATTFGAVSLASGRPGRPPGEGFDHNSGATKISVTRGHEGRHY